MRCTPYSSPGSPCCSRAPLPTQAPHVAATKLIEAILSGRHASLGPLIATNDSSDIRDIGSTPYSLVRPVLLRMDSAVQLRALEEASPHLQAEDSECWIRLIKKQFPALHEKHNLTPTRPELWHKVYSRYAKINAQQKAEAAEKLRSAFAGINQKKAANTSEIMAFDRRRLPLPKDSRGPVDKKGPVGRRGGSNDTGELRFTSGSRTKVTTAQSLMRRVKREAREIHSRNKIGTPAGALRVRSGQIKSAPKAMVNEQRIKNQPAVKNQPVTARYHEDDERDRAMEEREERLRKMKAGGKQPQLVSDSDLDDDDDDVFGERSGGGGGFLDEDELEDLFDVAPSRAGSSRSAATATASKPAPKSALLPGKRSGVLANARRAEPSQVYRVPVQPASTSASQPHSSPAAKPTSASYAAPSASTPLKPMPPRKRKPVDVFMKSKPKAPRAS